MLHGAKSDGVVTPEEFLEYYATISMNIDSDAYFELMMANSFNLAGYSKPYAGTKAKVTSVNARDAYRQDHHRNLFGTDKKTPWGKKIESDWISTNKNHFQPCEVNAEIPSAGAGLNASAGANCGDPKLGFS